MGYTDLVFHICEFVGTVAFAVAGAMVAIDKRVDLFGVLFLGMLTALGGGCLRDVLLGRFPPAMFSNYVYVTVSIGFLAVFMGMTTAIGGGVLRDLLLREIPFVLKKRIYAIAAICGALAYYIGWRLALPETVSLLAGVGVTFVLRLLATAFKWNLPKAW